MNNKSTKGTNPSTSQKEMLTEFLTKHPNLSSGKFSSSFTFKTAQLLWTELTNILNSIPGAQKDWKSWRKTWQDMRSRTKMKVSKINKHRQQTGGGPFLGDNMTKTEEDIVKIIKMVSIEGHDNVTESVADFQFDTVVQPKSNDDSTLTLKPSPVQKILPVPLPTTIGETEVPSSSRRTIPKRTPLRFKQTSEAVDKYSQHLEKKCKIKENYYKEKLEVFKKILGLKERKVVALERIADVLENM